MHATELLRPFHRPGWVYEEKYDAWRMGSAQAQSDDPADVMVFDLLELDGDDLRTRPPGLAILVVLEVDRRIRSPRRVEEHRTPSPGPAPSNNLIRIQFESSTGPRVPNFVPDGAPPGLSVAAG